MVVKNRLLENTSVQLSWTHRVCVCVCFGVCFGVGRAGVLLHTVVWILLRPQPRHNPAGQIITGEPQHHRDQVTVTNAAVFSRRWCVSDEEWDDEELTLKCLLCRVNVARNDLPWEFMVDRVPSILIFPRYRWVVITRWREICCTFYFFSFFLPFFLTSRWCLSCWF